MVGLALAKRAHGRWWAAWRLPPPSGPLGCGEEVVAAHRAQAVAGARRRGFHPVGHPVPTAAADVLHPPTVRTLMHQAVPIDVLVLIRRMRLAVVRTLLEWRVDHQITGRTTFVVVRQLGADDPGPFAKPPQRRPIGGKFRHSRKPGAGAENSTRRTLRTGNGATAILLEFHYEPANSPWQWSNHSRRTAPCADAFEALDKCQLMRRSTLGLVEMPQRRAAVHGPGAGHPQQDFLQ